MINTEETVIPMETVLFTDITKRLIGNAKKSELEPLMRHVGVEWGLNISKLKHFNIAKRIIINSAKNN